MHNYLQNFPLCSQNGCSANLLHNRHNGRFHVPEDVLVYPFILDVIHFSIQDHITEWIHLIDIFSFCFGSILVLLLCITLLNRNLASCHMTIIQVITGESNKGIICIYQTFPPSTVIRSEAIQYPIGSIRLLIWSEVKWNRFICPKLDKLVFNL